MMWCAVVSVVVVSVLELTPGVMFFVADPEDKIPK